MSLEDPLPRSLTSGQDFVRSADEESKSDDSHKSQKDIVIGNVSTRGRWLESESHDQNSKTTTPSARRKLDSSNTYGGPRSGNRKSVTFDSDAKNGSPNVFEGIEPLLINSVQRGQPPLTERRVVDWSFDEAPQPREDDQPREDSQPREEDEFNMDADRSASDDELVRPSKPYITSRTKKRIARYFGARSDMTKNLENAQFSDSNGSYDSYLKASADKIVRADKYRTLKKHQVKRHVHLRSEKNRIDYLSDDDDLSSRKSDLKFYKDKLRKFQLESSKLDSKRAYFEIDLRSKQIANLESDYRKSERELHSRDQLLHDSDTKIKDLSSNIEFLKTRLLLEKNNSIRLSEELAQKSTKDNVLEELLVENDSINDNSVPTDNVNQGTSLKTVVMDRQTLRRKPLISSTPKLSSEGGKEEIMEEVEEDSPMGDTEKMIGAFYKAAESCSENANLKWSEFFDSQKLLVDEKDRIRDMELAELRSVLHSLRPSSDNEMPALVIPSTQRDIVTAPVLSSNQSVAQIQSQGTSSIMSTTTVGMQTQPSTTHSTSNVASGGIASGGTSRRYKKESNLTFSKGTRAEYEAFKTSMKNTRAVFQWTNDQFGKEVFLSLSGKAAERISTLSTIDMCNADKLFEKLDKTFLPSDYEMALMDDFRAKKFVKGQKMREFYEDLKVSYCRARPTVDIKMMQTDLRHQMLESLPAEVYAKVVINFHKDGEVIADRYDTMISQLESNKYISVSTSEQEASLNVDSLEVLHPTCQATSFTESSFSELPATTLNYFGNNRGNSNNRGSYSNNYNSGNRTTGGSDGNNGVGNRNTNSGNQYRQGGRGRGSNPDWDQTCTYSRCGIRGHREANCRRKADDLYHQDITKDLVSSVMGTVQTNTLKIVTDHLKACGFPQIPGKGS